MDFAAQGFFFAAHGFVFAAQGFFFEAQGFFFPAQGLAVRLGAQGLFAAQGFCAIAGPPSPIANAPAYASFIDFELNFIAILLGRDVEGRVAKSRLPLAIWSVLSPGPYSIRDGIAQKLRRNESRKELRAESTNGGRSLAYRGGNDIHSPENTENA